jgi:hypothetical protein
VTRFLKDALGIVIIVCLLSGLLAVTGCAAPSNDEIEAAGAAGDLLLRLVLR